LDYAISSHAALSELFKSAATKTCGSYFDHPAFFKGDSARSNLRLEAKQLSAERGKARTGNLWHPLVAVENHVALFALGEKHAQSPTGNSKNPARKVKMFEYAAVKFRDTIFGPDNEYVSLSNIKLGLIWSARQLPLLDAAAQSD
jgi:hypothetical protein